MRQKWETYRSSFEVFQTQNRSAKVETVILPMQLYSNNFASTN